MTVTDINSLDPDALRRLFGQCCASPGWVEQMVMAAPFQSADQLKNKAVELWMQLDESEWLLAFEAHPILSDICSLRERYATGRTMAMAVGEQAAAAISNDHVLHQLARYNQKYMERFGFVFIVFASNKTAEQMLDILLKRIHNDRTTELRNAADEQLKITLLRLETQL